MRDRLLKALARLAIRRPVWVLAVAGVLTGVSVWLATGLELRLSFVDQLPEDSRERHLVEYANENFGGMDLLFVVLRDGEPEALAAAAGDVAEAIATLDTHVSQVRASIDLAWFRRYGLLYAPIDDLRELTERVEEGGPRGEAVRGIFGAGGLGGILGAVGTLVEEEILEDDAAVADEPDEVAELLDALLELLDEAAGPQAGSRHDRGDVLARLLGAGTADSVEGSTWVGTGGDDAVIDDRVHFFSPERDAVLLLVRPTVQNYDYGFADALMRGVDARVTGALQAHPGITWEATGNLAVMREENEAVTADMIRTSTVALTGILLLFLAVFRRPIFLFVVGAPLLMAVTWTFGFTYLWFGHFNIVTAIFAPILMGLGIDFAIHLVARYQEERRKGASVAEAAETVVVITGRGLVTGGLSTTCAFLVMGTARYQGMAQMGVVAGVGVFLSMLAMLTLVPAMLVLLGERIRIGEARPLGAGWSEQVADQVMRRPRGTLLLGGVVTAAALFGLTRLEFEYDMRALEPEGMPSIEAMKRIEKAFDMSIDYGLLLADDAAEEVRLVEALREKATVGSIDASGTYLPSDQAEKLPIAAALSARLPSPAQVPSPDDPAFAEEAAGLAQLERAARAVLQAAVLAGSFDVEDRARALAEQAGALAGRLEAGDVPGAWMGVSADLRRERAAMVEGLAEAVEKGGLGVADLPESIRDTYLGRDGRRLVYAYPTENLWHEHFMAAHVGELREVGGGDALGIGVVFFELITSVMEDFRAASLYSLLAVVLILLIDFRNPLRVLLALTPLLCGAVWLLGLLPALGQKVNYVNVAMVPIVLGIGIDDGVHMVHRYVDDVKRKILRREAIRRMAARTGRAVLLTSLTTMIGFGAIGLAHHQGLASLGVAVALGILTCYVASVMLLPAMLVVAGRETEAATQPGPSAEPGPAPAAPEPATLPSPDQASEGSARERIASTSTDVGRVPKASP